VRLYHNYSIIITSPDSYIKKENYYFIGGAYFTMWIITVYSKNQSPTMFEFESEVEAKKTFQEIKGCKILSEVIYYNDRVPALA
jgi:hypothetical protein